MSLEWPLLTPGCGSVALTSIRCASQATGTRCHNVTVGRVSKQRLFILDLLLLNKMLASGAMQNTGPAWFTFSRAKAWHGLDIKSLASASYHWPRFKALTSTFLPLPGG